MKSVCGTFRLSLANFENNKMDQFFKLLLLKEVIDLTTAVDEPFAFSRRKCIVPVLHAGI